MARTASVSSDWLTSEKPTGAWAAMHTTLIVKRFAAKLKLRCQQRIDRQNRVTALVGRASCDSPVSNEEPFLSTESLDVHGHATPPSTIESLAHIIFLSKVSPLLIFWPIGLAAYVWHWGDVKIFWFNFLAMVPLAKLLGDATEELAVGIGSDTVGGLLNATFGNAVEMILTIQSLRKGLMSVVKATLLGSIVSNLLLVLGTSFLVGGFRLKVQAFSIQAALTNMTMLFLATCSFALPTIFFGSDEVEKYSSDDGHDDLTLQVSRYCSIWILCSYVAFLVFQLYTHIEVFQSEADEDEEKGSPALRLPVALVFLIITTVLVAVSSECLVGSIDGLAHEANIGEVFIGIILLPIVGNACEHAGAVNFAIEDRIDITIGIAVGSATQIALFVAPFTVLVGWVMGQPMDLNFGTLNTGVMVTSVAIAFSVLTDGTSNWLEGFMLMIAYFVIATLYWFYPSG
mmetsp:Transcript_106712/g.299876  ORF Transcript_106712/g.299876 Transcript_106712/m.299876 type:complete len:458 (+) Transcript_106712:87-1460(+)